LYLIIQRHFEPSKHVPLLMAIIFTQLGILVLSCETKRVELLVGWE